MKLQRNCARMPRSRIAVIAAQRDATVPRRHEEHDRRSKRTPRSTRAAEGRALARREAGRGGVADVAVGLPGRAVSSHLHNTAMTMNLTHKAHKGQAMGWPLLNWPLV